jgi:hypothetical protein
MRWVEAVSPAGKTPDAALDALVADAVHRRLISRKKLRRLDSVLSLPSRRRP